MSQEDWTPVTFENCDRVAGPFYHGTQSVLDVGDELVPGFGSNFQEGRVSNNIYFSALVDTAAWGAELATALAGCEGRGHIYIVEPMGPFEDDPNVTGIDICLDRFEALVRGYLSTATFLNAAEVANLAFAGKLLTLECGIRFLTDYLEGDHYFHIARPDHNLDRARTQFTLVRQMEEVFDQMLEIVCPDNH